MQYDTVVPPDRLSAPSGTHLYFRLFQLNPTTVSQSLTRSSNPPSTSPEPSHYILTFAFTQTLNPSGKWVDCSWAGSSELIIVICVWELRILLRYYIKSIKFSTDSEVRRAAVNQIHIFEEFSLSLNVCWGLNNQSQSNALKHTQFTNRQIYLFRLQVITDDYNLLI